MARKRKSGSSGASMDSLLDTMTNVVGILVIILIVTQLGVRQAVKQITGLVSEEELAAAKADAEELEKLLELTEKSKDEKETEADPARLDEVQKLIAELEKELATIREAKIDAASLQRDLDKMTKEEESLVASITAKTQEIASLKARLADTPEGPDPDAKIVNLPDPRPAPEKAEAVEFLVKGGRLIAMDGLDALEQRAREEIAKNPAAAGLGKDPDSEKRARVDPEKLKEFFEKKIVADRQFRVKIAIAGGKPQFVFEPKEDAGIETERVERGFGGIARRYRGRPVFFRFRVFADSFETYIEARNVATTQEIAAGWVPLAANGDYRRDLGFEFPVYIAGYEIPKPRPPQPPDPNRPPPPPRSDVD